MVVLATDLGAGPRAACLVVVVLTLRENLTAREPKLFALGSSHELVGALTDVLACDDYLILLLNAILPFLPLLLLCDVISIYEVQDVGFLSKLLEPPAV